MVFNTFTICVVLAAFALVIGFLAWALLSTGLQEADDPSESRPEDLTNYEKRHTHRSDIRLKERSK